MNIIVFLIGLSAVAMASACNDLCFDVVDYVCGRRVDGANTIYRTFTNQCFLDLAICKGDQYVKVGNNGQSCKDQKLVNQCADSCIDIFAPVCASRLESAVSVRKTFGNKCQLSITNCKQSNNPYTFVKTGQC